MLMGGRIIGGDFSLGKFNVALGCFCGWVVKTQHVGKSQCRPLGTVLGSVWENPTDRPH